MIPRLQGSGNFLQDRFDEELDNEAYEETHLECGCLKHNCLCDSDHDERD
jgi:hypothetical protein